MYPPDFEFYPNTLTDKISPYGIMLNFLCFFVLLIAVITDTKLTLHYIGKFLLLTYQDKISNQEGYRFKSFLPLKIWDVLPIFMQEKSYHVRTEMRQSLV